jgi:hypothetical protein
MRLALPVSLLMLCMAALPQAIDPMQNHGGPDDPQPRNKLPNGKTQSEEILKADHAKSLIELKQITELSESLAADMERDTPHVLSLNSIKKVEEIERLARRVKGRMRKF